LLRWLFYLIVLHSSFTENPMATYRLGSSPAVHTPGSIAWAINGYAFENDRPQLRKVIVDAYLPETVADQRVLHRRG
jgi:hypothetical protein